MHNLHLCHCGHLVHGPIRQWQEWLGEKGDYTEQVILSTWLFIPLLLKSPFDEYLRRAHVTSHPSPIQRDLFPYIFNKCLPQQFSHHAACNSLNCQPIHGLSPRISKQEHIWPFLLQVQTRVQADILLTAMVSLCWCLSWLFQKGVIILQMLASVWCLHNL